MERRKGRPAGEAPADSDSRGKGYARDGSCSSFLSIHSHLLVLCLLGKLTGSQGPPGLHSHFREFIKVNHNFFVSRKIHIPAAFFMEDFKQSVCLQNGTPSRWGHWFC